MSREPIKNIEINAFEIPTDQAESDGTLEWRSTTIVVVRVKAADCEGVGYTFSDAAAATLIRGKLAPLVLGQNVMEPTAVWHSLLREVRNLGRSGIAAAAISAVDVALHDLKARFLGLPLVVLLGQIKRGIPIYGSGGFTSYSLEKLGRQLAGWVESGIPRVKMKVGREPGRDSDRVRHARQSIGPGAKLFVDANGAYSRKQALAFADAFRQCDVSWFEEPVSSDDLEGLRLIRDRAPAGMDIAAGEYGYDLFYFRRMLDAQAVDVLQADATRCAGFTGFTHAAALCQARALALSAHTAPTLHAHLCCALDPVCHVEYFHDHVRIEQMLFDGALTPSEGMLVPDLSRPGMGTTLKKKVAARYAVPF